MAVKTSTRGAPEKRLYRPPRLKVHGDFRKLTAAKGSTNNDGSGKPATKLSGPGA